MESEISICESELSHIQQLKQKATDSNQILIEIKLLQKDIGSIENDLKDSGTKSMDEVQKDSENIQNQIKSLRSKIDMYNEEAKLKTQDINAYQVELKDLQQKKLTIAFQNQERETLRKNLKDLQQEHQKLDKIVSVINFIDSS